MILRRKVGGALRKLLLRRKVGFFFEGAGLHSLTKGRSCGAKLGWLRNSPFVSSKKGKEGFADKECSVEEKKKETNVWLGSVKKITFNKKLNMHRY